MRKRVFIRLNLALLLVFLIGFAIIVYSINPFEASPFLMVVFYVVLFGLCFSFLSLIGLRFRIPFWISILIAIAIIFVLMVQRSKV